jgi:hypothetical protein
VLHLAVAAPVGAQSPAPICPGLGTVEAAKAFFTERGFPAGTVTTSPDGRTVWTSGLPSRDAVRPVFIEAVVIGDVIVSSVRFEARFGSNRGDAFRARWSIDELELGLDTWSDVIDTFEYNSWPPDAPKPSDRSSVLWPDVSRGTMPHSTSDRSLTIDDSGLRLVVEVAARSIDEAGCIADAPTPGPS